MHCMRSERKKREIQDLESDLRQKIIDLTGGDADISLQDVTLNVSSKVRFKVVDADSVPLFLKSNLPDPKRIEDYYNETGSLPKGVELSKTYYVKVKGSTENESPQIKMNPLMTRRRISFEATRLILMVRLAMNKLT